MRKLLILIAVVLLILFTAMPLFAPDDEQRHSEGWVQLEPGQGVFEEAYVWGMESQISSLRTELEIVQVELETMQFVLETTQLDLETTELQLEIAKSDLKEIQTNLEAAEAGLLVMQGELDKRDVEIIVLEDRLAMSDKKYAEVTKGVWLGATTGYPFGLLGTVNYQFSDRYMANGGIGYMGGFQIQVGFTTKVW